MPLPTLSIIPVLSDVKAGFPLVLAILLALPGCQRSSDQTLVLTGSSTVAPLVTELGRHYETLQPGTRIDVQTGGSSRGINDLRSGLANIGMVSRALHPQEQSDLVAHTIARDGIAIIVNTANVIDTLTDEQIKAIYTGAIRNWKVVGAKDAAITVVHKAEGHSTLELFLQYYGLRSEQIRASMIIGDNQQGIKTVAGNVDAIGYVSVGAAEFAASDEGLPIKLLPMRGIAASTGNIAAGSFPLSRPLNLVTKGPPSAAAQHFIDFARSPAADDIVRAQYFIALRRE